jgi:hypothetical protein
MSTKEKQEKPVVKAPTFGTGTILQAIQYRAHRDLLRVLLKEGSRYTLAEVNEKITDFKRKKAK